VSLISDSICIYVSHFGQLIIKPHEGTISFSHHSLIMLASTLKFLAMHRRRSADQQRLGQRFINMYIKRDVMSELYNETNEQIAAVQIDQWLQQHNYFDELPQVVHDIYKEQK